MVIVMECPDLFPLGDKWVLIGSLYKTNQWWVGSMSGNPPRFTPEHVGIVDYGNGYAAKTGTTWAQTGSGRRLVRLGCLLLSAFCLLLAPCSLLPCSLLPGTCE